MSLYHQIWNRPSEAVMTKGRPELQKATGAKTEREKEYISALMIFYKPGPVRYQQRIDIYSAAMAALHKHYPDDVDAAAFYALSLLADLAPDDTSLNKLHPALTLLAPHGEP